MKRLREIKDENMGLILIVATVIFGSAFIFAFASLPPPIYSSIKLMDLIENPSSYEGKRVSLSGWFGDSGQTDKTTYLLPMTISTGKSIVIIYIPITDTDYIYGVYTTNSFNKGVLVKLEDRKAELIGKKVVLWGKVFTLRAEDVKGNHQDFCAIELQGIREALPTDALFYFP